MELETRFRGIQALPDEMSDYALVDWQTVAAMFGTCVPTARKIARENGIPLVAVSERKRLPRWGSVRQFIVAREQAAA